jgi:hypothetical protein
MKGPPNMQGPPTPSGRILRAQLQGHCKAMPIPKVDPISFARDMVAVEPPLKLTGRWRWPKDGLYRVATRRRVYGGYLVHRGRVTRCSPAVRRRIHIWALQAQYWGDPFSTEP